MGALRAVECQAWGAEPGEIAEWYSSGYIDGDDEVCLAHGTEDIGYKQFSVPMVNVRATLKAVPSMMLSMARKQDIIETAKNIFYWDRTWRSIQDACELRDFDLEDYAVDLKQADAMQLCYTLADLPPRPKAERVARNTDHCYGGIFRRTDAKIFHHGKVHRMHEIAALGPFQYRLALERKLALEFCRMAGIKPRDGWTRPSSFPNLDMGDEEVLGLIEEEEILSRAREWWSSSNASFGDIPAINDFLRAHGIYEARKESL